MKELINIKELTDNYYRWYTEECCDQFEELEWLINCALSSPKEKDNIMEVLKKVTEHKTKN